MGSLNEEKMDLMSKVIPILQKLVNADVINAEGSKIKKIISTLEKMLVAKTVTGLKESVIDLEAIKKKILENDYSIRNDFVGFEVPYPWLDRHKELLKALKEDSLSKIPVLTIERMMNSINKGIEGLRLKLQEWEAKEAKQKESEKKKLLEGQELILISLERAEKERKKLEEEKKPVESVKDRVDKFFAFIKDSDKGLSKDEFVDLFGFYYDNEEKLKAFKVELDPESSGGIMSLLPYNTYFDRMTKFFAEIASIKWGTLDTYKKMEKPEAKVLLGEVVLDLTQEEIDQGISKVRSSGKLIFNSMRNLDRGNNPFGTTKKALTELEEEYKTEFSIEDYAISLNFKGKTKDGNLPSQSTMELLPRFLKSNGAKYIGGSYKKFWDGFVFRNSEAYKNFDVTEIKNLIMKDPIIVKEIIDAGGMNIFPVMILKAKKIAEVRKWTEMLGELYKKTGGIADQGFTAWGYAYIVPFDVEDPVYQEYLKFKLEADWKPSL